MKRRLIAGLMALLLSLTILSPVAALPAPPTPQAPTIEGLTLLASGGAVYYGPAWDNGGWDQIVNAHIRWGQAPAGFVYRDDGNWCVHPDFGFGDVLTLRNPETGVTIECTVGDAVAPQDQANWRSHAVIEVAWHLYTALGLQNGNHVEVYYLPNG